MSWLYGEAPARVGQEDLEGPMPQERNKPEVTQRQGQGRCQLSQASVALSVRDFGEGMVEWRLVLSYC